MENRIVFGKWEATSLLVNMITMQIFLNYPRSMAESAGTAGWLLSLYSSVLTFITFILISKLYTSFEGRDLLDISEIAGGKAGKVIMGSIILAYLLFIIPVVLREFGEDMKAITLENSPISFVILFFLVGMIAAGFAGLEAIARFSAIVVPIIAAGYYFIVIAVVPYFDFSAILPILGNGAHSIFISGAAKISSYSPIFILFLLVPFLKTNKNFRKTGYYTILLSAISLVTSVLIYLSAFPYPTALESFLPIYQLARLINYGRFFQRVESIFVLIWAASALIYLSTGFFFILHVFRKTFGLKYYKPLIIPMAILIFNLSLLPPNLMTVMKLDTEFFRSYIWIVTFIVPIVALLLARARLKSAKKRKRSDA